MLPIYFDNNATTPKLSSVREHVKSLTFGNPSSSHSLGKLARRELKTCRNFIADMLNAEPEDTHVIFTSGGTESNNWICSYAREKNLCVYTTRIEHSSIEVVLNDYDNVEYIPLDENGVVDLSFIEGIDNGIIFIHHVNSETGVIQPIVEIGERKKESVKFALDAAQSVGRLLIDVEETKLDFLSASGHKFHAGTGIGFLWSKNRLSSFIKGGGQQSGLRSGTENLEGAVSMKVALKERMDNFDSHIKHMAHIRDYFEQRILNEIPKVRINCHATIRVCNTSSVCFEGRDNAWLLNFLDRKGVYVSKGSACLSNAGASSKVLMELFDVDTADTTLRFSFSIYNTTDEVDAVIEILKSSPF